MRRMFPGKFHTTGTCFAYIRMESMLLKTVQQALSNGRIILNDQDTVRLHSSILPANFQVVKARSLWTQIVAKHTCFCTPAYVCQRVHKVAHKLAASEGLTNSVFHQI